jgi:dGTPase
MLIREQLEKREHEMLSSLAAFSDRSRGRDRPERPCHVRPAFQHDRDKIIHSKPFRRLKHKTQVFLSPAGDHYRTRLTHTIEVSQIARTIAKALFLNEDLAEAIALGHDLGHTPFGHAGERALDAIHPKGFSHWEQSLRVVDLLADDGKGLNLTWEVRDGILKHSKGETNPIICRAKDMPETLEGKIVRLADIVAYTNHDLEDAHRAKLIRRNEVPEDCIRVLGQNNSQRINTMVTDIINETAKLNRNAVAMSEDVLAATEKLRSFLFKSIYQHDAIKNESDKAVKLTQELYQYLVKNPDRFLELSGKKELRFDINQEVCDFIAGMSDQYALSLYESLFIPRPWD